MRKAFTLVELMIVLGIVALLTVVAVPNFLEAETRSRVSRVKSDFKTLAVAIDSYTLDLGVHPREMNTFWYGSQDSLSDGTMTYSVAGLMSNVLSTPVAYLSQARMPDFYVPGDEQYYTYQDLITRKERYPSSLFWQAAPDFYGRWRLLSIGPDGRFAHGFSNSAQLAYDPTNGVYSLGNIFRSDLRAESVQPDTGVLLPAH